MAYRIENKSLVIDGWENGIAPSPYKGIANIRNLNTTYYPDVAYVNYQRKSATVNIPDNYFFFAGIHSVNVSNNEGWIFSVPYSTMNNPVGKATSPAGLNYILDQSGQVFKQSAVNSSTYTQLGNGGRFGQGNAGIAYWNNYLVVFGGGLIEFCGLGTSDTDITDNNWNVIGSGESNNVTVFTTDYLSHTDRLKAAFYSLPHFVVNDPVVLTTTGVLPAGLLTGTTYYITATSDTYITISATIGGSNVVFSDNGSGTHTVTDNSSPIPLGNATNATFSTSGNIIGTTTLTIISYTNSVGQSVGADWLGATGLYNIIFADGNSVPANFTNGLSTVNLLSPLIYLTAGASKIQLLTTTVTNYSPYVSKVDGSLYFANGQFLGRIAPTSSPNIVFNPGLAITYSVSYGVTALPEQNQDTIVTMVDLKSNLVVAGQRDTYVWDYLSASTSAPSLVGEQIFKIVNLLSNIYILAGQKGNIYASNGYSSQLLFKMPDFISGIFDPVWSWGDTMVHRSRLFFQALAQTTTGTNILAGIFSLVVSPSSLGEAASGLVMEAQNSYGLTPAAGALATGVLLDNSPSANGNDSYYSAWSNGATTGGIDYNDTTLWQNFEPEIETDIIPIGQILDKQTFGNIEFKLDRPMVSGDQIKLFWRPSLSDSYTQIGSTFSDTLLSGYAPANISQAQWAQFKVTFKCASSGSSFIPLRELRLYIESQP